jgi:hypothetical protein
MGKKEKEQKNLTISLKANVRGRKYKQRKADCKLLCGTSICIFKEDFCSLKKKVSSGAVHKEFRGRTSGKLGEEGGRAILNSQETPILGTDNGKEGKCQQRRIKEF